MLDCRKDKFWVENIGSLLCTTEMVPLTCMNLESQLNAITRLMVSIFIVLFLLDIKWAPLFLLLSILFIIILYYIQRSQMDKINTENYKNLSSVSIANLSSNPTLGKVQTIGKHTKESKFFCMDSRPLDQNAQLVRNNRKGINPGGAFNNPSYMSENQRLVGAPNPKTLVAPVVTPPPAALDYWTANNTVNISAINEESHIDNYLSGYDVMETCADTPLPSRENFEQPSEKSVDVHPNEPGWVNISCGYNPEQLLKSDLPTNVGAGNCEQDPRMKQYNKNLYTQTIQPGITTYNQINEPVNSNIGISFNQQHPPLTRKLNKETGNLEFTEHDPRLYTPLPQKPEPPRVTESNVYDPRFSGYGTSYRSYTDDNVGQTRFYYDDVNAIRMPNYITRNNIDHTPFGDKYGPLPDGDENGNQLNSNIRNMANDTFMNSAVDFRTDLQERLMRKFNSTAWQQRKAPIRTGGQRMLGNSKIF